MCPDQIYDWIIDAAKLLNEFTDDSECGIGIHYDPNDEHCQQCYECLRYGRTKILLDKIAQLW